MRFRGPFLRGFLWEKIETSLGKMESLTTTAYLSRKIARGIFAFLVCSLVLLLAFALWTSFTFSCIFEFFFRDLLHVISVGTLLHVTPCSMILFANKYWTKGTIINFVGSILACLSTKIVCNFPVIESIIVNLRVLTYSCSAE